MMRWCVTINLASIKSKRIKLRIKLNHSIPILNPQPIWMNITCQGARPNKNWFRSTHLTEKVWQLILIDQYLLFKIRYYVVPNCGTANEINGALYHDMALSMETRLKQKLTSNFIFFHWSAPNPSEKMMIMYLPTIWVFTWYDSMSRDCHMTIFSVKKQSPLSILTCFKSCWD